MTTLTKKMIMVTLVMVMWIMSLTRALNDTNDSVREGASLVAKIYAIFMVFVALVVFDATLNLQMMSE